MEFSVQINSDEEGYLGRECPTCERYFKIKPRMGIPDLKQCYCPYCRHHGSQDEYWTRNQIEYAQSVALNKISGDLLKEMKKMDRKPKKNELVSIGITVKGRLTPITYYSETDLEEKLTCSNCTLDYAIYGTFGYCPDCAEHNSYQILVANLELVRKMLRLAEREESDVKAKLVENGIEDCISAFDGYARERCSDLYTKISFQNIGSARKKLQHDHAVDIASDLDGDQWAFVLSQFQTRHLLAHKMGVIDEDYVRKTNADPAMIGRKAAISEEDVSRLVDYLGIVAKTLSRNIEKR
jgi:uncharacterized protein YbaR (Trm112 family)